MKHPLDVFTVEDFQDLATSQRVCCRPVVQKVTDMQTGAVELVPIPCGSTQARLCPACADKARRLRIQQCREGWHRTTDPEPDDEDQDDDADDGEYSQTSVTGHCDGFGRHVGVRTCPTSPKSR